MRASNIRIDERDGRWCLSGLVRFDTLERPAFSRFDAAFARG